MYVTDTHPLVWYTTGHHAKLSSKARKAFDAAARGERVIWVPTVVLWEWSLLIRCGKVREVEPLGDLIANRFHAEAMPTADLVPQDIVLARQLRFSDDPYDTLIVATAQRLDCPLITKDSVILRERPCEVYWD